MRTASRLCHLLAILAVTSSAACTPSDPPAAGTGGKGTGGAGTGGSSGAGSGGAVGSGGTVGSGGSVGNGGSGGNLGTGGADASVTDTGAPPAEGGVTDGAGGDGLPPAMPSPGCGQPAGQALAMYIRKTITAGGRTRYYDLYLPTGYDNTRAYRLLFMAHGCDGSIPFRIETVTKTDAIIVAPRAASSQGTGGGCFDTGPGSASLTENAYFDEMLKDVAGKTCVDMKRVFIAGHSSGSWLSNLLGCTRAGVIRGQGNTAGGLPVVPTCAGPIAAMLEHDMQDDQNRFIEGEKARDRILAINKCGTTTVPYDYDGDPATPSPCVMYQGCLPGYPVVWCPTTGKGHSDQVGPPFPQMSKLGFWRFWSQF